MRCNWIDNCGIEKINNIRYVIIIVNVIASDNLMSHQSFKILTNNLANNKHLIYE